MRRVISIDNWGAALIAALGLSACGGNVKTTAGRGAAGSAGSGGTSEAGVDGSGVAGSGGATPDAGGSGGSARCRNPTPIIVAGVDTGFDSCGQGYIRRRKAVECPDQLPNHANCPDAGSCTTDSDCTGPYAYCAVSTTGMMGCSCQTGCRTDADCGRGEICMCGAPVGQCVPATCHTDSDCPGGYECASYATPPCGGVAFACQAAGDTCVGNSDCPNGKLCGYNGSHHVCQAMNPSMCVTGRPFLVEGSARLAGVAERSDWTGALAPRLDGLGEDERAELARRWTDIGLMEHASVAAFARFALQLLSLGAPAELLERTHAAMADETRHARLGFALAGAYAGRSVGPGALPIEGALDDNAPRGIVATLVREGCIGETVAALEAAEAREHASDPVVRAVLERITADETRHAELAWRTLRWALESGNTELERAVREELRAALDEPAPRIEPAGALDEDALLAHGLVAGRLRAVLRRDALERAVRPCARALLAQAPRQRVLGGARVGNEIPMACAKGA